MDSPYARELRVAIGVVQQAAKLSRAVISSSDKGVIEKSDLTPVTVADFAIQALLTSSIHRAFPADNFVGEESSAQLKENPEILDRVWQSLLAFRDEPACTVPASKEHTCEMIDWCGNGVPGPEKGRQWVFDPIDGTKTFVRGETYAVNVALLENGRQVLSVVGLPTIAVDAGAPIDNATRDPTGRGCIVFAVRGHGAWVRPLFCEPGEEVQASRVRPHAETATLNDLRSVTCNTLVASGIEEVDRAVTEELGASFPGCNLLGWVPRWACLALGLGNMTVWVYEEREYKVKVWDHAGATLLFEEVGGKITDVDGKDIDLSAGRLLTANFGWVAAPKHLHATVLAKVHEVIKRHGRADLLASP